MTLSDPTAAAFLSLATSNIRQDYPVHWTHVVHSDDGLVPQRRLHPVFAGSFDWHSSVHQTWLIVRLLRCRPDLPGAPDASAALDELITPDGCAREAAFFVVPGRSAWERPYGWAWLLLLDAELRCWDEPRAQRWASALGVLAAALRARWIEWLAAARRPVRTGTHGNTAFALGLVLDGARATDDTELAAACTDATRRWYLADAGYGGFEPDAADFLSPGLAEVDVVRRVLPAGGFPGWFERFLPDLDTPRWAVLREPVPVDDPADPLGSHLTGLALSRAWGWRAVARALPTGHRWALLAETAAREHARYGLPLVLGHGYGAGHWLATFATFLQLGALHPAP